jgi:hypothetical protein
MRSPTLPLKSDDAALAQFGAAPFLFSRAPTEMLLKALPQERIPILHQRLSGSLKVPAAGARVVSCIALCARSLKRAWQGLLLFEMPAESCRKHN